MVEGKKFQWERLVEEREREVVRRQQGSAGGGEESEAKQRMKI